MLYGSSFLGSLILCVPPKEKEKEKKSIPLFTGHTLLREGSWIWSLVSSSKQEKVGTEA
jgi:hypothetical protein